MIKSQVAAVFPAAEADADADAAAQA